MQTPPASLLLAPLLAVAAAAQTANFDPWLLQHYGGNLHRTDAAAVLARARQAGVVSTVGDEFACKRAFYRLRGKSRGSLPMPSTLKPAVRAPASGGNSIPVTGSSTGNLIRPAPSGTGNSSRIEIVSNAS